jgi:UbiD family decarboxylase
VEERVSPRLDITRYLMAGTPILFEDVEGYPGFKIAGNICNSRETVAKILGTTKEELIHRFSERMDHPLPYRVVGSRDLLKNRVKNPDIISHIPLVMYYRAGERYYTSATIVLAQDPRSGRMNASFHRLMYLGGNRFAIRLVPRDLYRFYQEYKEMGKDTRVVIICGVHPAVALAAATSYGDLNELELANSILEGGLECLDLGGIHVPKDCEVVMVGRILRDELAEEGPFVDLTGTFDKVRMQPVVEVEELYLREDPIWQVILPGGHEHGILMGLPQEPRMFKIIRNAVPSVKGVALSSGGCSWLHAVVSIKKRVEGEGKNAGLAALAAHPSLKRVIVVDEDIDITNPGEVEWALATRLRPAKGVIIIPGVHGSTIDPSQYGDGVNDKWIIDATIPLEMDRNVFRRVSEGVDF